MLDETRVMLNKFFRPYNEKFCSLHLAPIGCETTWLKEWSTVKAPSVGAVAPRRALV